jgi:PQQ-dependent dehydrogenase (methanol/ethanol family)
MRYGRTFRLAGCVLAAVVGLNGTALAQSASAEIDKRATNPDLWPAPGRDNKLTRHSTLADINTGNVGKMQMVWEQATGALRGHEGQPVVVEHDGKMMMYFSSGCPNMAQCNILQALDMTDPDNPVQVWNYVKKTDRDESAVPRACCDTVHRGVNYAKGKVIYHTLDGFVIALDATTGKEVWVVKHAWPEHGETITGPTLIAENLVVAGFGGDEFAARGRLTAYDIETGKEVWKCHATGSDKDVCLTADSNKANPHFGTAGSDIGISTYPTTSGGEWKIGGGSYWAWGSYDPELKSIFWSTGNPGHWSPSYRCGDKTHDECNTGKWDNKWSMTIFSRKVENGEVNWAYQMTPFDQWDYDGVNENILTDMDIDGKRHAPAREQVRDRGLGGEGRPQDRPSDQGARALAVRSRPEHAGLPVGDGWQGPAALLGRSQRAQHLLLPHQQLVHGGRASGAHAHAAGHGLRVRQRVHVSREAGHLG